MQNPGFYVLAGRAGFEYHPLNGGAQLKRKTRLAARSSSGGEGGIRTRDSGFSPSTHLAGEPNRPLWHLPEQSAKFKV